MKMIYLVKINELEHRAKPLFVGFSIFTAGGIRVTAELCKQIKALARLPAFIKPFYINSPVQSIMSLGDNDKR